MPLTWKSILTNEEERLFIPPNFKHLSFISPTFLYSQVGESHQVPDRAFLNHFVDDDLCLSINQGGKTGRSTDAPCQLGWVWWIMCKSLSSLSHKLAHTQVAVSHWSMCPSYLLYPTRDKYVRVFDSASPAGSVDMQAVSQGTFGLPWGNGQRDNRHICQQSTCW